MHDPTPAPGDERTQVLGVFALELAPDAEFVRDALAQHDAGALAALLGRDLGALVEGVRELDLVFVAAHFDPAEVLRPGWPLHRRLDELRRRAPRAGQGARIIAFGADRDGNVPQPVQPEAGLRGGRLRVLPFLLACEPDAAAAVAARMEAVLLDLGMAKADTALQAQDAFGARIEHARYLTVHDLAAMTALQYRNQGLEALWDVVETALLVPHGHAEIDAPPEPLLRYSGDEARIALFTPDAWRRRHVPRGDGDPAKIDRIYALYEARQRQFAAVLGAHGIDVTFVHCTHPGDL